jgi:protein-tyrosine phosphatase
MAATAELFQEADLVIALKEEEHRGPIETRFSDYQNKVTYWSIHDEDVMKPSDILPLLESQLTRFVDTLS